MTVVLCRIFGTAPAWCSYGWPVSKLDAQCRTGQQMVDDDEHTMTLH
jgi:hypothetical protein